MNTAPIEVVIEAVSEGLARPAHLWTVVVIMLALGLGRLASQLLHRRTERRLQADLGERNFLMLHNHGLLTCGSSIADTFLMMFTFQRACDIQVLAQNGGAELIAIEPQILAGAKAMIAGVTRSAQGMGGALAWPALLRKLDKQDPGYRL